MEIKDIQIVNGAKPDPIDSRDYPFEKTLGSGPIITEAEWINGYDIEKILGFNLTPNNQFNSYSCVGQGSSKYVAILDCIETGVFNENSAKAIYSQISLGYTVGAYIRDAMKLIKEWGSVYENLIKSYKSDGTTDETFMCDKSWLTPEITQIAKTLQSKDYRLINGLGIDYFARAIKDGYGMVAGVMGTNNGTWTNIYPQPPLLTTPQGQLWGHALYFGKFRMQDGKKQIGLLNSWGNIGDRGWQWLGEEWFIDSNRFVFNPWVLIDKPNNDNMLFQKEKLNSNVYLVNKELMTKIMIIDMPTLTSLGGKIEEVNSLAQYRDAGTLVWTERIIN